LIGARGRTMGAVRSDAAAARCAIALGLLAAAHSARPADVEALHVDRIAAGVYVHTGRLAALDAPGHDDIANIGFVVGSRCVAVIDTGGSVRIGRALRAAIKARSSVPICYVINTHVHVDHVLGNAAFKGDAPKFVGHAALADAIAGSRRFFVEHYPDDFDGQATADQVIGPDTLVTDTQDLDLGTHRLRLRAWPKAHTDSDLTVLVDDRVLWTGDLLFRTRVPALDGSVRGWLAAIDALERVDAQWIVPGHGPVARNLKEALEPERRYLQALVDGVRREIDDGRSIDDAIEHVGLSEKPNWQLWETAHAHNVSRAYQELEWN
jgi:quinoprotein relay system zinc metallohydrolase 2